MNVYIIIGILGVVSGLLCAAADVPLAYSGEEKEKRKLAVGRVSAWWTKVSEDRFSLSFWLSFIGQPGTYLTMWMLAELIGRNSFGLSLALKINTFISAYTGLLFHVTACTKPVVYRSVFGAVSEAEAKRAADAAGTYAVVPSVISAAALFLGTTVIMVIAILSGVLNVPKFFVLFNPVTAAIILGLLKMTGMRIVGPLGVGFALFAVVLITAGILL